MSELQPGMLDSSIDLDLPKDMEERGRRIAYYLEHLAEELPDAMLYASGATFMWLYDAAKKIGDIADEGMQISELD